MADGVDTEDGTRFTKEHTNSLRLDTYIKDSRKGKYTAAICLQLKQAVLYSGWQVDTRQANLRLRQYVSSA